MFVSRNDSDFFLSKLEFFSTSKLHALDEYWSNNSAHPTHRQIHELIEDILIQRGENTLKGKRINLIRSLEKSFLISNPMGRFSANIIGLVTKVLISINFIKLNRNSK
tara:strand:+ start:1605 stop:1928 length:324 start_codon:yes stop_codon:yes gene_type:complete